MHLLKKIAPHFIALLTFLLVCTVYFQEQLKGKVLSQGDKISHIAMKGELDEFKEKTGDTYYWNNGMFSGMPWRLLQHSKELNYTHYLRGVLELWSERPIGYFLCFMTSCYLVMVLLGISPWLSIIGSVALGLNTNYFVLLEAGHWTKIYVLGLFPLIFGGALLAFQKKPVTGALLFGLGTSIAIYGNHIQMLYYLVLLMAVFFIVYAGFYLTDKKQRPHLLKGIGSLALAGLLALASNAGQIKSSMSYAEDTMRGEPILEQENQAQAQEVKSSSEVEGLEWNYAMNWSNGAMDLMSMLIPRIVGGSSAEEVSADTRIGQLLRQNQAPRGSDGNYQAPMYWGPLPFTSGPYYMGAGILLIFLFSLLLMKPALRWAAVAALLFGCLLSMGEHASWLNRPMYDYFPLFNKFRSPNSLMNVLPFFIIIPGFMGLQQLMESPAKDKKSVFRKLLIAGGVTGGICLIFGLLGSSLLSFTGPGDTRYQEGVLDVIIATRQSIMQSDAYRALLFILLTGGLIAAYLRGIIRQKWMLFTGIGLLVLVDLWGVGRRYIDQDNFVTGQQYEQNFALRPVDQQIQQREPRGRGYYRVYDLSINTFNSSLTSKHHNTIGGYHPAKLQRYQDMIDFHISQGNQQVLNMLNAEYIITQDQRLSVNENALGNAWFVENLQFVETPREEIEALSNIDPARTAVVLREDFGDELQNFRPGDGDGQIEMVEYEPNHLVYESQSQEEQLAVFSEVWYGPDKGWEVTIDGQPAEMIRVNYILRALRVPAGEHRIEFHYEPNLSDGIKYLTSISSSLLLIAILGFTSWNGYQWVHHQLQSPESSKSSEKPSNGKSGSSKKGKRTAARKSGSRKNRKKKR